MHSLNLFCVVLSLRVPKLVIFSAFIGQKIFVATVLNNATVMENYDIITEAAGGKTVADIDSGLISGYCVKATVNLVFGHRVKSRRWLIKDYKGRILI